MVQYQEIFPVIRLRGRARRNGQEEPVDEIVPGYKKE